jgi:2,4-dienoyl-CoA reductase-like NADH-dependent reductase (Old Yellow Enzyme family)
MTHLFSPLRINHLQVANRVVMAPIPSGYARPDGTIQDDLVNYYELRAKGGVGMIIVEPMQVVQPGDRHLNPHLGLYDEAFVSPLHHLVERVHMHGTKLMVLLEAPNNVNNMNTQELRLLTKSFLLAAGRAFRAGVDGIMLSAADKGALHTLVSPINNARSDEYGATLDGRLRLPLDIIEGVRKVIGNRFVVAFRLVAEEFAPKGMTMQDARVIARRVVSSGVNLLDVTADTRNGVQIARFPGWSLPLAEGIKRIVPDTPVMGSGLLGEPHFADSVIRDGSIDMVMLGQTLQSNPNWTSLARSFLGSDAVSY